MRSHYTPEQRFWPKVARTEACWIWIGAKATPGYGRFYEGNGRYVYAHRFAYTVLVGPIADGMTVDHLCKNPSCVNPDHMEIVTQRENTLRGDGFAGRAMRGKLTPRMQESIDRRRRTVCALGHKIDGDNATIDHRCRECKNRYRRELRRADKKV